MHRSIDIICICANYDGKRLRLTWQTLRTTVRQATESHPFLGAQALEVKDIPRAVPSAPIDASARFFLSDLFPTASTFGNCSRLGSTPVHGFIFPNG